MFIQTVFLIFEYSTLFTFGPKRVVRRGFPNLIVRRLIPQRLWEIPIKWETSLSYSPSFDFLVKIQLLEVLEKCVVSESWDWVADDEFI